MKISYFHFKLSKFFLILFLRMNVIIIVMILICFITYCFKMIRI